MIKTSHAGEVREASKHGVRRNPGFMNGMPVKVASRDQMLHASSMMLYMLGAAAVVVESLVKTFRESLASYPRIYRQKVKSDSRKAMDSCVCLRREFVHMASLDKLEDTWRRTTALLADGVREDIMKLTFAVRNEVGKYDHDTYCMKADFILAYEFSKLLVETADDFGKFLHEDLGMGVTAELSQRLTLPIKGIYGYLSNLVAPVLGDEVRKAFLKVTPVANGFEAVWQKLLDWKAVENALGAEARREGVNFLDTKDEAAAEYIDSKGKPWNDTQERILEQWYGRVSAEDLAYMLGRTKEAIWAKARKLGLRKV